VRGERHREPSKVESPDAHPFELRETIRRAFPLEKDSVSSLSISAIVHLRSTRPSPQPSP
jgi:hypothetical protein